MAKNFDLETVGNIISRAHYLANQMVYLANHRDNKSKGDPKVGGHSSATCSSIHILGVIHLLLKNGYDFIANKPHASPADHSFNYLLDLFLKDDFSRMSLEDCNQAMHNLRAFSQNGEPVFQSYHSIYDPDHFNFFPSGTVGIPPVNAGYLALAYRYAKQQGFDVPDAHFWCLIGDSEFREGSLFEAIPDFAEREIEGLTWVVDYNRQSLDGHRLSNPNVLHGSDDHRIKNTLIANGWEVLEARHGHKRMEYFGLEGGKEFQNWFENELYDYELQALLNVKDPKQLVEFIHDHHGKQIKNLDKFLKKVSGEELIALLKDFGGHDVNVLYDVLSQAKKVKKRPCLVLAHTLKGWGLEMAAVASNHNMLPDKNEMDALREKQGIPENELFQRFDESSKESEFLQKRGEKLYQDISLQTELKEKNIAKFRTALSEHGDIPESLNINFKMASYPHTQWMLGQLTSKLTRIANTPWDGPKEKKQKPLSDFEKSWKQVAELMVSMAPDVGTSTNLNPSMDGKVFGTEDFEDIETELSVKDGGNPDLVPGQEDSDRFIRFEIAEQNTMSCMGSLGRLRDTVGIPILPLMTIYDFFIKRAHDQYFYDLYWKSSFIMVGTPAGVTLSPEGAQHGWKSDFQIPNQITWEPFYVQELDWIFCESIRRHMTFENEGRTGVLIRGVTRGADQKQMMKFLKAHTKNQGRSDDEILQQMREDVLNGGYYLIDYRGYEDYKPGDNVVQIFSMGSLTTEAIKASDTLKEKGIYANVIVVTSPDLLIGNLGQTSNYSHLRNYLEVTDTTYFNEQSMSLGEAKSLSATRVPIVSVHDGEPGLLDNIGSIVGVRHEALATRKHSKCGRPDDVYKFHGMNADSVVAASEKVLEDSASSAAIVNLK